MVLNNFLKFFSKLFPVPKSLSFDFVGVDICDNSVKVMKLRENSLGKIPIKHQEYILKNQCGILNSDPNLNNCEELVEVFKTIKKDFKVDYVNVSIPEINTYIYRTKLPNSVGKNILKTLEFSVGENVPIDPNNVLIDYFVINDDGSNLEIIVTAVPKNIIEKFTELLEKAGLKPLSFEPETHAIARCIINKGDKGQYLLLNLDKSLSSIAVIENQIVQYTQTLPIINHSNDESDEEIAKVLKENINKVMIYWATSINQVGKEDIRNLFLVGEKAFDPKILNYLEKNLSLNIKLAKVWTNCFKIDEYIPEMSAKESIQYATAIGLALKNIR